MGFFLEYYFNIKCIDSVMKFSKYNSNYLLNVLIIIKNILGFVHILISTIFTYLFISFLGRKVSSFFIVIFNILYLSYLHIKIMYYSPGWNVQINTLYMMTICKFSSLAFAYEDGAKKDEDIKNSYWRSK